MLTKEIRLEILKMAVCMLPICLAMVGVFYLLGYGDYTVWLGALLGMVAAVGNYFLLAVSLALQLDKKRGKGIVSGLSGFSYIFRMLLLGAIIIYSIKSPHFNYFAVIIPLVFPSILVKIFGTVANKKKKQEVSQDECDG